MFGRTVDDVLPLSCGSGLVKQIGVAIQQFEQLDQRQRWLGAGTVRLIRCSDPCTHGSGSSRRSMGISWSQLLEGNDQYVFNDGQFQVYTSSPLEVLA